jgi:hypothetical protein
MAVSLTGSTAVNRWRSRMHPGKISITPREVIAPEKTLASLAGGKPLPTPGNCSKSLNSGPNFKALLKSVAPTSSL